MSTVNEIAVICPSRGRNNILKRCITSWKETTDGLSDFYVVLDDDDFFNYDKEDGINYRSFKRTYPCDNYNKMYPEVIGKYNYFFTINDDVIYRTAKWESMMLNASREFNYYGMVFPNDGNSGNKVSAFPMFGYKASRILDWFAPPFITSAWADFVTYELFCDLKLIKYVDTFLLEHMHYTYKKSEFDITSKSFVSTFEEDRQKKDNWIKNEKFNCVSNFIDKWLMDEL